MMTPDPHGASEKRASGASPVPPLRIVFWETTKACNLRCQHCRAIPEAERSRAELSTAEGIRFIDQLAEVTRPVLILSGGEPLYRPDIFDLAAHGRDHGFRMALATNGTLVDAAIARRIRTTGFSRVAVSLDGAVEETHDRFRRLPGSHARAVQGLRHLRDE